MKDEVPGWWIALVIGLVIADLVVVGLVIKAAIEVARLI